MQRRILALGLFLTATAPALACNDAPGPATTRLFAVQGYNAQRFVDTVTSAFDGNAMGYAVVLRAPDGRLVAEVASGWARTDCEVEGPRAFDSRTVTSWASASKVVTAAAILNKIERFPQTRSLDERLVDLFPERWPVGACATPGRCWSEATIAHALSHRVGFRSDVNAPYEERFASGISERPVGERAYANESFDIFDYLGHFLAADKMRDFEDANTAGDLADYSQAVRAEVRLHWAPYLQREVFGPSGIQATCADVAAFGSNYARAYADVSDSTRGRLSTPQNTGTCTTGGMVMSVSDMTKFLHALSRTDRIISNALFREEMTRVDDLRVGFDSRIRLCGRLEALGVTQVACNGWWALRKNGASGQRIGTEILVFSDGSVAAFARNSGWREGANVDQIETLLEAWLRAKTQGAGSLSIQE
jgi:CubicO group peptidase (beta-lactamase class C family)